MSDQKPFQNQNLETITTTPVRGGSSEADFDAIVNPRPQVEEATPTTETSGPSVPTGELPETIVPPNPNRKRRNRGILIAALGTAAATLISAGVIWGLNKNKANGPSAPDPNATGPLVPGPDNGGETGGTLTDEQLNALVDAADPGENLVEVGMYEALTPEQKAKISELKGISDINEFRARDIDEQRLYAYFVFRNNLPIAMYRLDHKGLSDLYQIDDPTSPEGMIKFNALVLIVAASLKTFPEDGGSVQDFLDGEKLSVLTTGNDTEVGNQLTAEWDSKINLFNLNTPILDAETHVLASRANTDSTTTITYEGKGTDGTFATAQNIIKPLPFTDIFGKKVTINEVQNAFAPGGPGYEDLAG